MASHIIVRFFLQYHVINFILCYLNLFLVIFPTSSSGFVEEPRLREQDWGNLQNAAQIVECRKERQKFGAFYYRFPQGKTCMLFSSSSYPDDSFPFARLVIANHAAVILDILYCKGSREQMFTTESPHLLRPFIGRCTSRIMSQISY